MTNALKTVITIEVNALLSGGFTGFIVKVSIEEYQEEFTMNKTELIAAIAERTELTKKDADQALKAFIDVVGDELSKGEKIQLAGFGTFEVTERAARDGINPRTKETIHIPASKAPKFKPMKSLKEKVNN